MSKFKYPSKEEIDQQISHIINTSGVFDSVEDNDEFVEMKPIQSGSKKTIINSIALIAAACLIVMVSKGLLDYGNHMYLMALNDNKETNAKETVKQPETSGYSLIINAHNVVVSYVDSYSTRVLEKTGVSIYKQSIPKIVIDGDYIISISNDISEICYNKREAFFEWANENSPDKESTEIISMNHSTEVLENTNDRLISFEVQEVTTVKNGENDDTVKSVTKGITYDINSKSRVLLSDIISDSEMFINSIIDYISSVPQMSSYTEKYDSSKELYTVIYSQFLVSNKEDFDNWYFSDNGIVLIFDTVYNEDTNNAGTLTVPYEKIKGLKGEYNG